MNKMLKRLINNRRGGTVLMLTILILSSIISVALVSADIIINGLKSSRIQNFSTIAFFAAEAGAERVLEDIRKVGVFDTITCANPGWFCYDAVSNGSVEACTATEALCPTESSQTLTNNAEYKVHYEQVGQWTNLTSTGSYNDTNRVVEISFCTPDCTGANCGVDDGCGDACPPTCETEFGCLLAAPANAVAVNPGSCCTGSCYECDSGSGYGWDGSACVDNTYCGDDNTQDPNSAGISELCDGITPLGGNQECAVDCLAIGYGFYMENNNSINMDNAYFTAVGTDERYVNVTCKGGRTISVYGLCETGVINCNSSTGADNCEIGCSLYALPNESYYQFVCR